MQLTYSGCNPLDRLGDFPRAVYELSFVPQNRLLPDSWLLGNWGRQMTEQVARIGRTPALYPIQGEATVITQPEYGAVVNVMARSSSAASSLQSALSAVEDSYGDAKLVRVKRLAPVTITAMQTTAERQSEQAADAGEREAAAGIFAKIEKALGWSLVALIVVGVIIVAYKAPKLDAGGS